MGKLHEVLAVEGDLAGTSKKIIDETRDTFSKRNDHFLGDVQVTTYFDEANANLNTTESKAMVTTVAQKLDWLAPNVSRYWDAYFTKELTNQEARADVEVNGKALWKDVPATVLLGMESKLKELRSVYEAIPTLQPGLAWEESPDDGDGVWAAKAPDRFVTKNTLVPVELSPATKEHKAQVQAVPQDIPVARRVITQKSGMLTVAAKSDLLEKIDTLIRAVKTARQKANSVEAKEVKGFGKALFDFING